LSVATRSTPSISTPGGELAVEAFQVIGEAMMEKGLVGIGRVTIASRERLCWSTDTIEGF
jgi:non-homologous end joining protein Ku